MSNFTQFIDKETDSFYGVDLSYNNNVIKCILFDMQHVWIEEINKEEMLQRQKLLNSSINYNEELIKSTLLSGGATIDKLTKEPDAVQLVVKYYVKEYPVLFHFNLKLGTPEQLSSCIIMPLWRTALLLSAKNKALREELELKDIEIAQYCTEGAILKRTSIRTAKFDAKKFDEEFPMQINNQNVNVQHLLDNQEMRTMTMKAVGIPIIPRPKPGPKNRNSKPNNSAVASPAKPKSPVWIGKRKMVLNLKRLQKGVDYDVDESE
ncbi:non-homologous end-joining factor 1-like [Anopheles nili]|uniref:non-homologous end-joining factor 1-like n=1 Tax=Anopheles nili TaxID=185578 RepID=UPI00237B159D|nr:non-homologous end-joining factor 1-like [Anopheles nili]